jgi:hypothetical protein
MTHDDGLFPGFHGIALGMASLASSAEALQRTPLAVRRAWDAEGCADVHQRLRQVAGTVTAG